MREVNQLNERTVESSGAHEEQAFTIQADGKAFKILIDGLYSDKPRAIVRELCSNAFDSHVLAGTPERPFKVILPTRWDNTFSVRDYGVSLSHEQIMGLYRTVFGSTKENSNVEVGKFGLGSKSPFAYTDAFTVTAIQDNVKRLYNAYLNEKRIPVIALFHTEDTDEETGIEVSFPVREDDVMTFATAAKRVFLGLDVQPECNIRGTIGAPERQVISEGNNWRWYRRDEAFGHTEMLVRQGCVLYPVDVRPLNMDALNQDDKFIIRSLADESIILDMPIGSVDITPSRETISYDATTSLNLAVAILAIKDEVVESISRKLVSATCLFDAMKLRKEILRTVQGGAMRGLVMERMMFRGRAVGDGFSINAVRRHTLARHGLKIGLIERETNMRSRASEKFGKVKYDLSSLYFDLESAPTFFYSSDPKAKHIRYRLKAAYDQVLAQFRVPLPLFIENFDPHGFGFAALKVSMGRMEPKVVDIMSLTIKLPTYAKAPPQVGIWRTGEDRFMRGETPAADVENVFYVYTDRGVVQRGEASADSAVVATLWDSLRDIKLIDQDAVLVGIGKSLKGKDREIPDQWSDFFATAETLIRNNYNLYQAIAEATTIQLNAHRQDEWHDLAEAGFSKGLLNRDSRIVKAFANTRRVASPSSQVNLRLARLARLLLNEADSLALIGDYNTPSIDAAQTLNAEMDTARRHYPMLTWFDANNNYSFGNAIQQRLKMLTDYINLVDAEDARQQASAAQEAVSLLDAA